MEGARYALNKRTGHLASAEYSIKNVEGIGRQEYICTECNEKLILKKGDIKKPHFAHEAQDKVCSYYSKSLGEHDERAKKDHDQRIHQIAIRELKQFLEEEYKIIPMRKCSAKGGCTRYANEVVELQYKSRDTHYKTEYPIIYNDQKRILDLVRIDNGKIKYNFEILDCHRTTEDSRPTDYEWFEIYADDIIKIRTKIDNNQYIFTDGIQLDCQRQIFKCQECFEAEQLYFIKMQAEQQVKEERKRLAEVEAQERRRLVEIEGLERRKKLELAEQEKRRQEEIQQKEERRLYRIRKIEEEKQDRRDAEEYELQCKQEEAARRKALERSEKKCIGCKINYCKCTTPAFIEQYNRFVCTNCKKHKCTCPSISRFFQTTK